jgi:hypothetical protein
MTKAELVTLIQSLGKEQIKTVKEALGESESSDSGSNTRLRNQEALNSASKEHLETIRQTAALLNDMEAVRETNVKLAEQEIRNAAEVAISLAGSKEAKENIFKMSEDFLKAAKEGDAEGLSNAAIQLGMDEDRLEILGKQLKAGEDARKGQKEFGATQRVVLRDMAKALGMSREYKDTFLGGIVEMNKGLNSSDPDKKAEAMKSLAENFQRFFNVQNLALAVFSKLYSISKEMFVNFDSASAALAKATGQGRKFQGTLYEVAREGNQFGISMADARGAIESMVSQTSNFTNLSKATARNIALTTAKMEKLGVATSDSAAIFQNFNQGLGISAEESSRMQVELAMAGTSIGISSAKITKDFNASLSTLMVYGRESMDVFKGLAAAAKAAGVETSTLLGVASKFDTFAGAAEGVGKLNSLLGTQLSTTEMLMATEDERIKMLVESVQAGGVAFKDMNRFQQKAIANAAGITDMAEANRVFGMSLEAYEENERKLKASADAQKKMEEALAPTVKLMDTMKLLGQEMVVALQPVIETLQEWADSAREFFGDMDTETKELWAGVGLLVSGLLLLAPIFASGGMLVVGLATTVGTLGMMAGASTATAGGITATTTAAAAATPVLAGLAVPLAAVAVELGGILGAAGAIAIGIGIVGVAIAAVVGVIVYSFAWMVESLLEAIGTVSTAFASMFSTSDADVAMEEFKTRSVEAMAEIASSMGSGDSIVKRTAAMVAEINKLGQDVKVSSTIENLALLTAGTATSITGEKVKASTTNVTAKVQNFFEGMQMTLSVDGEEFKGYVENISEKVAGEVAGGERVV